MKRTISSVVMTGLLLAAGLVPVWAANDQGALRGTSSEQSPRPEPIMPPTAMPQGQAPHPIPTPARAQPKAGMHRAEARSTWETVLTFQGGQQAEVLVLGDGDTDLDLFIYDENGRLEGSDTDRTDKCIVRWVPARTGRFTIKVENLGTVFNEFLLFTDPVASKHRAEALATWETVLTFQGGEAAAVAVIGRGNTDLDLFIYDESGRLVAEDTGLTDDCRTSRTPPRTGRYTIKVKNLGRVPNEFLLFTNGQLPLPPA